jgi:hypothetical protein
MTKSTKWLIAGAAALALVGTTAIAGAQAIHQFTVQLPGGGVEHISYTGDAKPVVVVLPADPFAAAFAQWPTRAFAGSDQIQAQMDRQMNAMLAEARAMQSATGTLNATFANVPRGAVEYTQISTWTGNGMCTRTVRMFEPQGGGKLQTVSSTSGDCGGDAPAARAPTPASDVIQAKATATPHHAQPTRT